MPRHLRCDRKCPRIWVYFNCAVPYTSTRYKRRANPAQTRVSHLARPCGHLIRRTIFRTAVTPRECRFRFMKQVISDLPKEIYQRHRYKMHITTYMNKPCIYLLYWLIITSNAHDNKYTKSTMEMLPWVMLLKVVIGYFALFVGDQ
jgi:hypothetical protein